MAVGDIDLDDERRRAELAKLQFETQLIEAQTRKTRAETEQKLQIEIANIIAETGKLHAENAKLNAENAKISRETRWYPLVAASIVIASSVAALGVIVVKLIHG